MKIITSRNNFIAERLSYDIIRTISKQMIDMLKTKFIYSVDITELSKITTYSAFDNYFKNIPKRCDTSRPCLSYFDSVVCPNMGNYYDITRYNGVFILISIAAHDKEIMLSVKNCDKNKKVLSKFIEHIKRLSGKMNNDFNGIYARLEYEYPEYYSNRSKRSFDTVFLPKKIKNEIITSIDSFIKNKQFYDKHCIPYHFGILLHGEPGTGKSSIIPAIVNHFNIVPYYLDVGDIRSLTGKAAFWKNLFSDTGRIKAIIIEDVDACEFIMRHSNNTGSIIDDFYEDSEVVVTKDNSVVSAKKKIRNKQFSEFLNILDGNNSFENVLWIFTTNDIESIDPAVIRPGRMDVSVHIGYVTDETMSQFLKHHYNRDLPKDRHIKDDLTFAEIQTCVMENASFDEVLERYCK